ncbi:WG repeat-containing protein [Psychrobacter sp. 16-MNA-CIBAN-0192]|uniref:WG repeat-containing protein n=1 Tax=Psychrobacter sp. 16-MNA-CIBAN-0192 TaxID=3140448 RepID=UPI003318D561
MSQRCTSFYRNPLKHTLLTMAKPNLYFTLSAVIAAIFIAPAAQAASCKIPKTYYKNVTCTSSSGYFLAIKDYGEPVALIDSKGKVITDLSSYQKVDATKISDGLLPVLRKGRVGYINMQGQEVIPPVYDTIGGGQNWARAASDGRIVVKNSGQFGVINTSNQTVVPFSAAISDIDNFKGGRARIRKNKTSSWVDKNGNPVEDFAAKAPSNRNDPRENAKANVSATSYNPPKNVGNKSDSKLPPSTNQSVYESLIKDNVAENITSYQQPVSGFTTLQPNQQDGKWGYIDANNVVMITYSFDEVRPFAEGLAGVRVDNNWGFLNLGGEVVIPFDFDNNRILPSDRATETPSFVFKNGRAWVNNLSNGAKMCINKSGSYVGCE